MNRTPSLRRMWTMYQNLLVEDGMSRRDQVLAQSAFYGGARGVLKVLNHLLEHGQDDELRSTIQRQADRSRRCRDCGRERGGTEVTR
jgi:hypothetical protein